jgi:hypothetical protein
MPVAVLNPGAFLGTPATTSYLDLAQGLQVIPAASYKSDHEHIMPLVPRRLGADPSPSLEGELHFLRH